MTERLLQFIWQFQYFNTVTLQTEAGEGLQVIKPGFLNCNQGPDFLEASVKIGAVVLVGNIELHVKSSDWTRHFHSSDKNYFNIILHVVWENDAIIKDVYGNELPTLVLQNLVAKILLDRYEKMMNEPTSIPCKNYLPALSEIGWLSWKERLAVERLEIKSGKILNMYEESGHHWEEVFWWMLAYNFGLTINASLFEETAKSILINILAKHKNQVHQLEAMLLGQANLLEGDFKESYPKLLQKEYRFLQKKYRLKKISLQPHFLRMRPANFPTLRLAQLAMLIHHSSHLFSKIKELKNVKEVEALFKIISNDYWHYHYRLDEISGYKPKQLGKQMIHTIIVNTVIPVLFTYGLYTNNESCKATAIQWLSEIEAEKNTITQSWIALHITNSNALESQALIQLYNHYCKQKKCLDCAVGNKVLKS